MKKLYLLWCGILGVCVSFGQTVEKYGPVLHYAQTSHKFDPIQNNSAPAGMEPGSTTVLIKGQNGNRFATYILDIGDNQGTLTGINPFRFIIFQLDSTGKKSTYKAINVMDTAGNPIQGSLGRTDGLSTFGPNGKIYIPTYGLGRYLVEFDPNSYTAKAYPVPAGLAELFIVGVGPRPDASNPKTLIYGGTFNATQVWWFDPSDPHPQIKYTQFELDGQQNYVHQVVGKGDWVYARLSNKSLAGNAYRSLWAVNTQTQKKYLLFHTTKTNFSVGGLMDKQRPGENNIFLILNGKSPGTIYPNPTAIPMSDPAPAGVLPGSNCPCYNIDPSGTYWSFPASLRRRYFKAPYFSGSELTGYTPENTSYQYNQNYAWDRNTHQPFVDPPAVNGQFICNPRIDNGTFFNMPWDMVSKFPNTPLPTSAYNYYFRLNGGTVDVANPIEDGYSSWSRWESYDPLYYATNKPQTSWDGTQTLTYQFPGKIKRTIKVGMFTQTGNPNDLHDYDADLSGLAMTASSGTGWINGAPTLVKGEKKEGFGVVNGEAVSSQAPLGYSHQLLGRYVNEQNDIVALGQSLNGRQLATHVVSGYPGEVDFYSFGKTVYQGSACYSASTGISPCNPRLVSKMYPLEIILPNGNSQYGPEVSLGVRLYSPDYYVPNSQNEIRYKVMSLGTVGRARQGKFTAIGIHEFTYNDSTGNLTPAAIKPYRVIDRLNYSYFDNYTPLCLTNEVVALKCAAQPGGMGDINSPFNEGKGYTVPANTSCAKRYIRSILSERSLVPGQQKNQLWIFNPTTEKIDDTLNFTDPELNAFGIDNLKTVTDFYVGKTSGCDALKGTCSNIIFLFRIKNNAIDTTSIVKFKNANISSIVTFTVTPNIDSANGNGKIAKVFISYLDNVSKAQVGSFDIIAKNGRKNLSFGALTVYQHPNNEAIKDFAYVPKLGAQLLDLLMVGGKNVYVLKSVVPLPRDSTPLRPAPLFVTSDPAIDVYPNPFSSVVNISTAKLATGHYEARISDNAGKLIVQKSVYITKGMSSYQLQVPSSVARGNYILELKGQNTSQQSKLVKQ